MRSVETAAVTPVVHSRDAAPRSGAAGHDWRDRGGVVVPGGA
jgi:hypothetical protein